MCRLQGCWASVQATWVLDQCGIGSSSEVGLMYVFRLVGVRV